MTERIRAGLERLRPDGEADWLDFAAKRSVQMIRADCGLEEVPEELEEVGVTLALWVYDSAPREGNTGAAKSIREGDVAIGFAETAFGRQETEREMLAYFSEELAKWRRMRW